MRKKDLKDMSLEELWELFPIVLQPHNPKWTLQAQEIINELQILLSDFSPVITHIGSTAVPGIVAKPIIDILIEVPFDVKWDKVKSIMETHGFICMSESENRVSFNKGYTTDGYADRVYHVHFHRLGDND